MASESMFRELLPKGYQAEIVCREEAYRKASVWYGEWVVRLVNRDRTYEKILCTTPRWGATVDEFKVRTFRTINGLSSFMHDLGFTHMDVPFVAGGRSVQSLPDEALEDSR